VTGRLASDAQEAARAAEAAARRSYGKLIAFLAARTHDVAGAEDALSEAFAAALADWPLHGVPRTPEAWLLTVARRKRVDALRRQRLDDAAAEQLLWLDELTADENAEPVLPDRRLGLLFACAHPGIDRGVRAPLMLQVVLGFDAATIASAFLVAPAAMGQRLARAKAKIRATRIPFRVPPDEALPARLEAVLDVVCLVFNEGYAASAGDAHVRQSLCAEGVRLAAIVAALMPDEPEALALHALLLANHARRHARVDASGALVLLEDQDRGLWDAAAIAHATRVAARALRLGLPGRYALQAAIAIEHANARTAADTRWEHIAAYYGRLAALEPDPVVELNRAVAIAMAGDVTGGLARIDGLAGALERYHYFHAARADLLLRLGVREAAADAYARAAGLAGNEIERAFLDRRLAETRA
jgi:RNA polymerase sigma-70 factor, ECF subfamily